MAASLLRTVNIKVVKPIKLVNFCSFEYKAYRYLKTIPKTNEKFDKNIFDEIPDIPFHALRLGEDGCSIGRPKYNSFSSGFIDVDILTHTPAGKTRMAVGTTLKTLFSKAIQDIQKSQNGGDVKYDRAIQILNKYLKTKDFHEECLDRGIEKACEAEKIKRSDYLRKMSVKRPETKVAILLAVHLLSQLISDDNGKNGLLYVLSDDYKDHEDKPDFCPCGICGSKVTFGSTLIGSTDLFIGELDIVLYPNSEERVVNIVYQGTPETKPSMTMLKNSKNKCTHKQPNGNSSFVEVKPNSSDQQKLPSINQVALETITCSFFHRIYRDKQHEFDKEKFALESLLVPTIAICDEGFNIFMYDSVNDVFLKNHGPPIRLFDVSGESLRISSVVYLWMVINHALLQPKLSQNAYQLKGSFGLLSRFVNTDMYERIKETMGMDIRLRTKNKFKEWDKLEILSADDPDFKFHS